MSISEKITAKIPQLRFPEFSKEWKEKRIEKILRVNSGKDYKYLHKGSIPVYGTGGLMLKINDYLYDGESVAIGRKGTIDQPQFLVGKFWTVDTLFYTSDYIESIPRFIFSIFQNINWQKYNEASGVPSLSKTTIEKIKVFIPEITEQQKIADFLSAVDQKIDLENQKLENLEQFKKAISQQIFSQRIRFPGFSEDWEEEKLGNICDIKTGKKDANESNPNGKYPFFTCAKEHTYSDTYSFDGESIMIAGNGEVGLCSYYDGKLEAYQRTYVLQNFKTDSKYLYLYLSNKFQEFANKQKQKGSMPYIKLSTLNDFKILIQSEAEQQKIADFLSSIDQKIDLQQTKLDQLKNFKKSLLQRMFI